MNIRNKSLLTFAATFFLSGVQGGAVLLDPSVSGFKGGFTYAYTINNQTGTDIFDFSLTVPGDVGLIQSPNGWIAVTGVPAPGETLVQWVDLDVAFDVPAIGSLSGFQISSTGRPGSV